MKSGGIEIWKKILSVVGILTQTTGYFLDSKLLVIVGLISSILGIIFMFITR